MTFLSSGQDAELVYFRIRHNYPRCAALTDVDTACPETNESLYLSLLIVGHPIHVEPVFVPLLLGNLNEHHAGPLTRSGSQLH